jgi:hypothetical protein
VVVLPSSSVSVLVFSIRSFSVMGVLLCTKLLLISSNNVNDSSVVLLIIQNDLIACNLLCPRFLGLITFLLVQNFLLASMIFGAVNSRNLSPN